MNKLLVFSIICLIVGAIGACEESKPHTQRDNEASWIHYYKDKRTDICFAGDGTINGNSHLNHDHSHLTSVPCTDTVERLLEPWPDYEN